MAIKFQYNKTSLQQLEKQLKIRLRTLPIIKNKESALRLEVKRARLKQWSWRNAWNSRSRHTKPCSLSGMNLMLHW